MHNGIMVEYYIPALSNHYQSYVTAMNTPSLKIEKSPGKDFLKRKSTKENIHTSAEKKNKKSEKSDYTKYRSLIASLSLFSLLVVAIMALSLYVSHQLEKDTKIINTAFEQTSLLNQVVSDLYIINSQYNSGQASNFTQKRLEETVKLIDNRMTAFRNGGPLPVVSIGSFNELDVVTINPLQNTDLIKQIDSIWLLWEEYKRRVGPALNFTADQSDNGEIYNRYQFYGSVLHNQGAIRGLNRINLHTKTDSFALQLQEESDKRLSFLRIVQITGIVITGISLLLILFFIVRQLRRSDTDLENAREEAKGILNTIQEGLFLIHQDQTIGSEYSGELENILGTEDIAGRDVFEVLSEMISDKDTKNLGSFINSLFNPKVVASLIMDLNPLKQLHIRVDNEDGTVQEKYLSFNFYRVIKKGEISEILVSAKDITDRILLQEKLELTEHKNEEQVRTLIALMKIDPKTLKLFLDNSSTILHKINSIFKDQISDKADFEEKIRHIFANIHTLKGESSAIGLKHIAEKSHAFENELDKLRSINNIGGMNFLPLAVILEQLISYTENIAELAQRLGSFRAASSSDNSSSTTNAPRNDWKHLQKLVNDMAAQYDKKANLVTCGLSEITINDQLRKTLNSILVHMIKNSMVHGIESPAERYDLGKPEHGRIDIRAIKQPDNSLEIIIRDDGRGLDSTRIANKLIEKGLASAEEVLQWREIDINKHIFSDGFSTANVDIHAGRGVGLSAIYQAIKDMGGQLKVKQHFNQYCQFSITFPTTAQ